MLGAQASCDVVFSQAGSGFLFGARARQRVLATGSDVLFDKVTECLRRFIPRWDSMLSMLSLFTCCLSIQKVIESPLRAWVRDFLTSEDVLHMRTTGVKWNIARLYGRFADLFFFLLKKEDDKRKLDLPPEWPGLRYDFCHFYGFDKGIFEVELPDLTVLEGSG